MTNETLCEIEIDGTEFHFSTQIIGNVNILKLDNKKGGFVFLQRLKESLWIRFAKWVDLKLFKNIPNIQPEQWMDISWFNNNKHIVRSYRIISVDRNDTKEATAAYASSLGILHCFLMKENPNDKMPDYTQVHFRSIFGNKSYIYGKITDHDVKNKIISSFMVCKTMSEKQRCLEGTNSLH